MNEEEFTICKECEQWFKEPELNEYGLCVECEAELQKEKKSIQDTENSLYISER